MIQLFNTILVSPLFNFLVYIYDTIRDIGIAIIILTLIAAAAQYFQGYFMQLKMKFAPVQNGNKTDFAQIMQKQMLYMMPVMILIFSLSLPAALPLYWIVNTLFT